MVVLSRHVSYLRSLEDSLKRERMPVIVPLRGQLNFTSCLAAENGLIHLQNFSMYVSFWMSWHLKWKMRSFWHFL